MLITPDNFENPQPKLLLLDDQALTRSKILAANENKYEEIMIVPESETQYENHYKRVFIGAFNMLNHYNPDSNIY